MPTDWHMSLLMWPKTMLYMEEAIYCDKYMLFHGLWNLTGVALPLNGAKSLNLFAS